MENRIRLCQYRYWVLTSAGSVKVTGTAGRLGQVKDPRAVELMESYAASRWRVLWQLRVPASVPYIFTALKISATASVIGAIIGETPASIQDGLGGAIVNFNQYYSLEPTFLWATNVVCAALGIVFFLAVAGTERLVLRGAPENVA